MWRRENRLCPICACLGVGGARLTSSPVNGCNCRLQQLSARILRKQAEMNTQPETLRADLSQLAELLHKYGHKGQAAVVDEILATIETSTPDYKRLGSVDMWGGSGAVWEVCLIPSAMRGAAHADETSFRNVIIRIAAAMDQMKIGTDRTRFIAKTFQGWLDKGLRACSVRRRDETCSL